MNPGLRSTVPLVAAVAMLAGCNEEMVTSAVPAAASVTAAQRTGESDDRVVLDWNSKLIQLQGAGNLFSFRQLAMMHVAMFDAVNAVEGRYQSYHVKAASTGAASAVAAAAQAAHDVLVALYPQSLSDLDALLQTHLEGIAQPLAMQGAEVGSQAAAALLAWRANDGSAASFDTPYTLPALAGMWQSAPQPPGAPPQVAAGTRFLVMQPFGLVSSTQFLPAAPPPLDSAKYGQDWQFVYDYGRADSAMRSPEQTLLAKVVAGTGYTPTPFAVWNSIARQLVAARELTLSETARLFALLNVSMHDGLLTSQRSKFAYGFWRPVTAIQSFADDANAATTPDPAWAPLLGTPPYPSHASNLACIYTSAARALGHALGSDEVPFDFTWKAAQGADATLHYDRLSQLAHDGGMSRVYGGIHFTFEITASETACTKATDYIIGRYMQERSH
jgi:hypothetical protein